MKARRSPKVWLAAAVASSVVAASYSIYNYLSKPPAKINPHTHKSIALTLSHLVLNSLLPLEEILTQWENVTFILPPNLSLDDLEGNIDREALPQTLVQNYKLLNCKNIQGYFNLVKNLKPDMLLVCTDDLGISGGMPKDLARFVKEIVTVDQDRESVYKTIGLVFLN